MSYYAEGKGFIRFKNFPYEKEWVVREPFGKDKGFCIEPHHKILGQFYISYDGKYSGYSDVKAILEEVAETADIDEGWIEFAGEEWGDFWRFIWIDGEWVCQDGEVVYEEN